MKFTKMCGAGNDFVVIENFDGAISRAELPELARRLCRRRFCVGADGLMVLEKPEAGGDCKMLFFNNDGSSAEMCGNGARCLCRYCVDHGLSGGRPRIETPAGVVTGERIAEDQYKIRLNTPSCFRREAKPGCDYLELGNPGIPHAVVPYAGLRQADENELRELGRKIRWYADFPKGANVNFYEIIGEDLIRERTFERGVEDFTYACGTGTGSVVTVLTLQGRVSGKDVRVIMPGGELRIDAERVHSHIASLYLTGPTNIVCKGEITDEDLPPIPGM